MKQSWGIYFLPEDSSPSNDPDCPLPSCLGIKFTSHPPPPLVCACDTHSTCLNAETCWGFSFWLSANDFPPTFIHPQRWIFILQGCLETFLKPHLKPNLYHRTLGSSTTIYQGRRAHVEIIHICMKTIYVGEGDAWKTPVP